MRGDTGLGADSALAIMVVAAVVNTPFDQVTPF